MGSSLLSFPEARAEALQRALSRGYARLTETALILGYKDPNTVRAKVERREIETFTIGKLKYVSLEELERLRANA